jgi:hypothetical protein
VSGLSKQHVAQAREQIRELVVKIRLVPTVVLTGCYAGLMKLAVGVS